MIKKILLTLLVLCLLFPAINAVGVVNFYNVQTGDTVCAPYDNPSDDYWAWNSWDSNGVRTNGYPTYVHDPAPFSQQCVAFRPEASFMWVYGHQAGVDWDYPNLGAYHRTTNPNVPPTVSFVVSPYAPYQSPQRIEFYPTSTNVTFWNWSFGDGDTYSGTGIPSQTNKTYTTGTYTAVLNVTNSYGTNSYSMELVIYAAATPTPTPSINPYRLTVSPSIVNGGINTTGILSGSLTAPIEYINYYYHSSGTTSSQNFLQYPSSTQLLSFVNRSNVWYAWSEITQDFTIPVSIPTTVKLNFPSPGTYKAYANIAPLSGGFFMATSNDILVEGSGSSSTISVIDASDMSLILEPHVSIKNLNTNIWTNTTIQNPMFYVVNYGDRLNLYATKTGYISNSLLNVMGGDRDFSIMLYPEETSPFPNTTMVQVLVTDANYAPIDGATINIKQLDPGSSPATYTYYDGYTNAAGFSNYIVVDGSTVKTTASKSGYLAATTTEYISGASYTVRLKLLSPYIVPTAVPPTILPTPIVTITNAINMQPINQTVTTCNASSDGTMIGEMKKNIACMGFKDYISQSLALASLIVIVFMLVGGRYGKGLGTALGAIVGFVLGVALGLIPFWVFIALIILSVGAIAFKALVS